jgi:hypothetical protein
MNSRRFMGSHFGLGSEPYHIIEWELCCASRQKSAADVRDKTRDGRSSFSTDARSCRA